MKNLKQPIITIIIGIAVLAGVNALFAWTEPTQAPPGGNVAAPINVSSASQYKSGALGVGGVLEAFSDICLGGVCRNTWPAAGTDTRCDTAGACSQVCVGSDCRTIWPSSGMTYGVDTFGFGGMYTYTMNLESCANSTQINPYTGGYSCPSGFSARVAGVIKDYACGEIFTIYWCYKL